METLLGLAYRTFNHGRTPEQNRQHRRELKYAEEKARVLGQRPSPLPTSRKDLSQTSLSINSQMSCPLFTYLPLEIRQRIYVYVLGGSIIHLTHISKRIVSHRLSLTDHQINDEEPPTGKIPLQMPPTLDWQGMWDERHCIPRGDQASSTVLSLLQTCHAVYKEASPVLYNSNTFSMSSPLVLLYLKDYVILPQRFAEIRDLQLVPWVFFDNPEHHLRKVHEPYDNATWPRFWDVVAEMNLRSLGLWVEYWGRETDCTIDAPWIQPLLKVRNVKSVGIQLQLRAGAWDTRRLRDLEDRIQDLWTSSS